MIILYVFDDTRKKVQLYNRPWWVVLIYDLNSWKSGRGKLVLSESRQDEILVNLVLSLTSSWVSRAVNITDQTWDITPFRNRQNWWEPLPTTGRSIGPNDTVPKTVISYCQNHRFTWREMTVPWECYKSTDLRTRSVFKTSIHFSFREKSQRY